MRTERMSTSEAVNVSVLERLVENFFNPYESWGRENRDQLFTGIICTAVYLAANFLFTNISLPLKSLSYSTVGLTAASTASIVLFGVVFIKHIIMPAETDYPWYERYMPKIITLLGLGTLTALLNIKQNSPDEAALWINLVLLFIVFIITAGYFVEGRSNEKVIKIWFALLGYYFSVIAFFYLLESFFH